MTLQLIFNLLAGLLVVVAVSLSAKTSILKDAVLAPGQDPTTKMYSFARTIGMWWTVIIAFCFIIGCGHDSGHLLDLNATCLTLLGIGAGTTAVGRMIDNHDTAEGIARYQEKQNNKQFFRDLLTDGPNLAVHRFQALVFNVVFGVVFLVKFFSENYNFPDFANETLGLLGISAGAYLSVKATENQPPKNTKPISSE